MLGFATIAAVIGVGALIAHLGVVDLGAQQVLNRVAFFVASPALLLTTVAEADVSDVLAQPRGHGRRGGSRPRRSRHRPRGAGAAPPASS